MPYLDSESLESPPEGRTFLDFVAYDAGTESVVYIFRLLAHLHASQSVRTCYFRFSKADLALLYRAAEHREWAKLIIDLIERGSDRAFLHVQQALQRQHAGAALTCDMICAPHWSTCYPPSAQEMLKRSLTLDHGETGATLLSDLDDENLGAHAGQVLQAWLPCGHRTEITP